MTYKLSEIRKGIAEFEKTPPAVLEKLALQIFGEGENVMIYLLSQMLPNATTNYLEALEKYVKNNPYPENLLSRRKVGYRQRELISDWQKLWNEMNEKDAKNLENLVEDSTKKARYQKLLDEYPEADSLYNFLNNFAKKLLECLGNIGIGISLLGNPSTPKNVRERLFKQLQSLLKRQKYYSEQDIYLALAFNSAISKEERNEYIHQVIVKGGNDILAKNSQTPSEFLVELATSERRNIKNELAKNPNTPPDILRQLAQEESSNTRSYVAKNPSTPTDIIVELANEKDSKLSLRRCSNYVYRTYYEWRRFSVEYPRMPKLELYRILLAKEIEEETTGAKEFINYSCTDIPAIQSYIMEHSDRSTRLKIATHWNTPLDFLEKLLADPDAEVRAEVAKNRYLPLHFLLQLTKHEEVDVRKKLVEYPDGYGWEKIPVEILEALANDESEEVRALIAINPCAPVEVFRKFANDTASEVKKGLVGNVNTPVEILKKLANDNDLEVKKRLVSNVNTPVEVLDRLWRENGLFDIRNPNTPGHVLAEAIAQTKSSKELSKLLDNLVKDSQIPASTLENLASHKDSSVRSRVAKHPNTPSSVLAKLAEDKNNSWYLARNRNAPAHILQQIFNKCESEGKLDGELCRILASRIATPAAVLEYLAKHERTDVRGAVASNPSTPISTLKKLALQESQESVLRHLKNNPSLDSEVVAQLAQNPQVKARLYTIDSPHITPEIWQKLARDESPKVREAIAAKSNSTTTRRVTTIKREVLSTTVIQHPHLPLELWQELATDSEVKVRQAAAINPDAPISILELLAVDEKSEVRQKLADNSNLLISILERLGMDISAAVREVVAKSDRSPGNLLEQLALDEKREIMQALIDNLNTPASVRQTLRYRLRTNISPTLRGLSRLYEPETDDLATILSEYVTSSVPFVRLVSLMHPLTPIPCLEVGAKSTFWWERYAVAVNSATPVELRQKLVEDSYDLVKAAALNSRLG